MNARVKRTTITAGDTSRQSIIMSDMENDETQQFDTQVSKEKTAIQDGNVEESQQQEEGGSATIRRTHESLSSDEDEAPRKKRNRYYKTGSPYTSNESSDEDDVGQDFVKDLEKRKKQMIFEELHKRRATQEKEFAESLQNLSLEEVMAKAGMTPIQKPSDSSSEKPKFPQKKLDFSSSKLSLADNTPYKSNGLVGKQKISKDLSGKRSQSKDSGRLP